MIKRFFVKLLNFFFCNSKSKKKFKQKQREHRIAHGSIKGYFRGIKDALNNNETKLKKLTYYDICPI
jgi:hypothetical protein